MMKTTFFHFHKTHIVSKLLYTENDKAEKNIDYTRVFPAKGSTNEVTYHL